MRLQNLTNFLCLYFKKIMLLEPERQYVANLYNTIPLIVSLSLESNVVILISQKHNRDANELHKNK